MTANNMSTLSHEKTDKRLMLLNDDDNVLMVIQPLMQAEIIWLNSKQVRLEQDVKMGFKLARNSIKKGAKILKYGYVIGVAVEPIEHGEIVHFHNIASNYLPSVLIAEQKDEK